MHNLFLRHGDLKLENILINHVTIQRLRAFPKSLILTASSMGNINNSNNKEERANFGEAQHILAQT